MSYVSTTQGDELPVVNHVMRVFREAAVWLMCCVACFLLIALLTYSPNDPGWSNVGDTDRIMNTAGRAGAWFADISLYMFGYAAYFLPFIVLWMAIQIYRFERSPLDLWAWVVSLRLIGCIMLLLTASAYFASHFFSIGQHLPSGAGGGLGAILSDLTLSYFNILGADLLMVAFMMFSLALLLGVSWLQMLEGLGDLLLSTGRYVWAWLRELSVLFGKLLAERRSTQTVAALPEGLMLIDATTVLAEEDKPQARIRNVASTLPAAVLESLQVEDPETKVVQEARSAVHAMQPEPQVKEANNCHELFAGEDGVPVPVALKPQNKASVSVKTSTLSTQPEHALPGLDLLDKVEVSGKAYTQQQLDELSQKVETTLADFGVKATVVDVAPGPVVTMFELELAPGVKASKITGLSRDIARALTTMSVRVVEIIPGKSVIGIEIPNRQRELVSLRWTLDSTAYKEETSPLAIALGSDISGNPVAVNLAKMPHVLIAGTTGSGKSVAINTMILSLLYKSTPDNVRLIMVDPKMLELSVYQGIPHLLTPVVTDVKDAANALRWCVGEMERRYRLMSKLGVRNIAGCNRMILDAAAKGEGVPDPLQTAEDILANGGERKMLEKLPYIVVIIDELADMMMVVGKKVEELIARLAQKARASGIHLVLATQRPSVDVLTGLIKANIPTRIAFQVSSRIDSRTIIDQMGAEHLLGYGDMLYLPPGTSVPQRLHGAFVDDDEVHRVVDFLRENYGEAEYRQDVLQEPVERIPGLDADDEASSDVDPLFDEAVAFVVESRRGSISGVQRRLKIGYNRAARMVEEMERIGIVGPAESGGNREVLAPPPAHD